MRIEICSHSNELDETVLLRTSLSRGTSDRRQCTLDSVIAAKLLCYPIVPHAKESAIANPTSGDIVLIVQNGNQSCATATTKSFKNVAIGAVTRLR
jgi:hypothetical protein